jgi:hypothetical protein
MFKVPFGRPKGFGVGSPFFQGGLRFSGLGITVYFR